MAGPATQPAQATDPAKIPLSVVTTKGDSIVCTGAAAVTREGVGADGQVLIADSTSPTGRRWATLASTTDNTSSPVTSTPITAPITPTPAVGVDPSADLTSAIAEFAAEYIDSTFRVVQKDESTTKVTSESIANGMLQAVLGATPSQTRYDGIRNWATANLQRSNNNTLTRGTHLWGCRYEIGTGVPDPGGGDAWNWAMGAESVRAIAISQAIQLWNRQQDIDDLKALRDDIVAYCINFDEGHAYVTTDSYQQQVTAGGSKGHHADGGGVIWEMNLSYCVLLMTRVMKTFDASTVWDQVLAGTYDAATKAMGNSGPLATTAGLPPNYCAYSTNTHSVSAITNGSSGWTYTRDTNYGYDAFRFIFWLSLEASLYNESRALTLLGGNFKTWATAQWAASTKFVDVFTHAGSPATSIKKFHTALVAYLALVAVNAGDTTAASIKSTWLTGAMQTNGYGKYYADSPDSTASSYYGNAWMIFGYAAINGAFAKLTQVSGIAGKYSAATPVVVTTPPVPTYTQPAGSVALWSDPTSLVATNISSFPSGAGQTRATWLASIPQAIWSGPEWDADGSVVGGAIASATSKSQWPTVVCYGLPGRDLGGASAGGSAGATQYRSWYHAVGSHIGSANCILILEPDSIPQILQAYQAGTKTKADYDARLALLQEAIVWFRANCPNTRIYVDSAHSAWFPDPSPLIPALQQAGVENAHGISTNVSNFRPDAEVRTWSNLILSKLNISYLKYVYDCGRNAGSAADPGDFENPGRLGMGPSSGRRFGTYPQYGGNTGDANCAGYLYVKRPGESDGNGPTPFTSNGYGAPPAGQFDMPYLYNTSASADGVAGCGMLRLSPTPGVAGG